MSHAYIIGINFGSHDSSASLYHKGEILCSLEEERFNKEKHTKRFPEIALSYIIKHYKLCSSDNVLVVYFMNPWHIIIAPAIIFLKSLSIKAFLSSVRKTFRRLKDWQFLNKWCRKRGFNVTYVKHHLAHAASAYYLSPFDSCTIVSIDGKGEYLSVAIFTGKNGIIKKIKGFSSPFSVGYFYSYITEFLGFKPQSDEYKVMGLAAFGKPVFIKQLSRMFYFTNKGTYHINLKICRYWTRLKHNKFIYISKLLGKNRTYNEVLELRHKDIAASLQKHTEDVVENIVRYSISLTQSENLCLTGGVALNCVSNSNLAAKGFLANIFVPPFPNDSGTSLGAALLIAKQKCSLFRKITSWTPFLGVGYSNEEIFKALNKYNNVIKYEFLDDPSIVGADLLIKGKIIGWYHGRMEFGPRALGNRSILAPATDLTIKDKLNIIIKHREKFRPFAPMILSEYCREYFNFDESISPSLQFMICTGKATKIAEKNIPAALNADKTARIQAIDERFNYRCYKLLKSYHASTGIPAIINTSFNVSDVPIVNSPDDAIMQFIDSNLDYCFLSNYLIKKNVPYSAV